MLRDAVVDTIGLLLGQLGATRGKSFQALADRQKMVSEVGGAALDLGARAFEPLLERHIGTAVAARIEIPGTKPRRIELAGHLAEYDEKDLVRVNESHAPKEVLLVRAGDEENSACASLQRDGDRIGLACTCDDALFVRRIVGRAASIGIGSVLVPGSRLAMDLPHAFELQHAEVERTRRLDFVCPRARSQVPCTAS